jgi:protein phosphatase 1G
MEDAHICAAKLQDRDDMSLFGVFDGHGGAEVAQFCAKYFISELVASDTFQNGDFDNALKQGFHKMDTLLGDETYANEIATVRNATFF